MTVRVSAGAASNRQDPVLLQPLKSPFAHCIDVCTPKVVWRFFAKSLYHCVVHSDEFPGQDPMRIGTFSPQDVDLIDRTARQGWPDECAEPLQEAWSKAQADKERLDQQAVIRSAINDVVFERMWPAVRAAASHMFSNGMSVNAITVAVDAFSRFRELVHHAAILHETAVEDACNQLDHMADELDLGEDCTKTDPEGIAIVHMIADTLRADAAYDADIALTQQVLCGTAQAGRRVDDIRNALRVVGFI